jgi:hypothetical protein
MWLQFVMFLTLANQQVWACRTEGHHTFPYIIILHLALFWDASPVA